MWLDLYLSHHPLFFLDETNLLDIHGTFLYLLHSCINQEDSRANMPLQQDLTGTDLMDNLNLREEEEKKIKKRLSTNKKYKKKNKKLFVEFKNLHFVGSASSFARFGAKSMFGPIGSSTCLGRYKPARHFLHSISPSSFIYKPGRHSKHVDDLSTSVTQPVGHGLQVMLSLLPVPSRGFVSSARYLPAEQPSHV